MPGPITLALLHASDAPTRFLAPLVEASRARDVRLAMFDAAAGAPVAGPPGIAPADCDALLCLPPFRPRAFRHVVEAAAGRLRWIHSVFTGVEEMLAQDWFASATEGVPLTNSRGSAGPSLSEWAVFAMLYFCKDIPRVRAAQRERRWQPFLLPDFADQRVGIVGLGGIGCAVARRCAAMGARAASIWGLKRDPAVRPADLPAGVRVGGLDELPALLAASDYVVAALPDAPGTRGVLDAAAIARMKPGAVLINVGRGSAVDEDALADAVARGALSGAALDVFRVEPLPRESRMWGLDRVLVSPHTADKTDSFTRGVVAGFAANLDRFLGGEPLADVVDKRAGY